MKWSSLTEEEQEYIKQCILKVFEELVINIPKIDVETDLDNGDNFDRLIMTSQVPPTFTVTNDGVRLQRKLKLLYIGHVYFCLKEEENEMNDLICIITLYNKEDFQGYIQVLDEDMETAQNEYKKIKQQHLNYIENCIFPLSLNGPVSK